MKRLTCPVNGLRDIAEFQYLGPLRTTSPEDPAALTEHLFYAPNPLGPMIEWWRHRPTNTVFLAERHTVTDEVLRSWLPDAPLGAPAGTPAGADETMPAAQKVETQNG